MRFSKAKARRFRLFHDCSFELHPQRNFIVGANAAGKTSLLEALYVASRGDSHRGATSSLVTDGESSFQIEVQVSNAAGCPDDRIDVRWQERRIQLRINEQSASLSDLVRRMPVLLVDLATPSGAAAIFLNLNPTYNVLDAVNDAHRCDQTLIDTAFPKHGSGLYVLSLPEDLLGRGSFEPEQLLKLMQVLRGLFAYTVVAIDGHAPIAAVAGLVDMADRTLLLSDQSILKSRHNKYLLRALRAQDCSLERASLVVDNYRRRLGLEPRNLAELFELPLLTALHTESFNRLLSMNSGEPLFTLVKKDPYCGDVRDLATTLLSGDMKPVAQQQGFLDRLLR